MMRLADAEDREHASFALDANVIVEAGAGTGKTRILIDRLCLRLLAREDSVDSFVALTFTEKAAAELRLRLSAVLGAVASGKAQPQSQAAELLERLESTQPGGRGKAMERARAALAELDRAQIGTIHSFASHLLRLYPLEAGVDPSFEVDEGTVFEELFETEMDKWLEGELRLGASREKEWEMLLRLTDLPQLKAFAANLCLDKVEAPRQDCAQTVADFCSRYAEDGRNLLERFSIPGKKPRKLELELGKAVQALEACALGRAPAAETIAASVSRVTGWDEASFSQAKKIVVLASSLCASGGEAIELGMSLLGPFVARFRRAYAAKGAVSFDGLLVKARNLLRDNYEVRRSLKRKYAAVFIDEFQDTDPLQGELLLYLCERESGAAADWRHVALQPGKLFVVGDPKQSIYRFRGADMGAYGQFTALMERQGARRCFLTSNFRSCSGIINAVNAVSGRIIAEKEGFQPAYVPISPACESEEQPCVTSVRLVVYNPDVAGGKVRADESRRAQADEIARRIREMLVSASGALRCKDMAVLVRSASPLPFIIEAFRKSDIPYVVEEDRYFYGTQEVSDMLCLLRALSDPGDMLAVAGLLRSPLCPVDDLELYKLRRAGGFEYLKPPPEGFGRLAGFYSLLAQLHSESCRLPLGAFVRRVLSACKCAELLSAAYNGQQTLANVEKFAGIADEFGDRGLGGIGVFLSHAGLYMEDKRGEGESPLADESLDAVRIMTVHKAKGLEFPVVFLPDLCAISGGTSRKSDLLQDWSMGLCGFRVGKHCDKAMPVLECRAAEQQVEEEKRILYVALTRAKRNLILLGGPKPAKDSFASYLASAGVWPDGSAEEGRSAAAPVLAVEYIDARSSGDRRGKPRKGPRKRSLGAKECKSWAAAWNSRNSAYEQAHRGGTVSATAIMEKERESLPADRQEPPESRLLGIVCHKVLESHDFSGVFSGEEISAAAAAAAFEEGIAVHAGLELVAAELLRGFAASGAYAEIKNSKILARELRFSFLDGDKVVRGVMDLVLDMGGTVKILDYKTAGAKSLEGGGYKPQEKLYLAAAARIYPGRKLEFALVSLRDGVLVQGLSGL